MPERRLLILTPEYPPQGGGIGSYSAQVAEAAASLGVRVRVVSGRSPRAAMRLRDGVSPDPPGAVAGPEVRYLARRPGPAGSLLFLAAMAGSATFAARRFRPDAVLCGHLEFAPVGRFLRTLGLVRRTAAVVYGTELFSSSLKAFRLGALRRQDMVVAISRYTREASKDFGVPEEGLRLLHPAIPRGEVPPGDRARGRAALGLSVDSPVALTVARMDPRQRHKGHDLIIAAWPAVLAALPGACWVVVGDGADRPRIEAMVRERGLSASVRFTGRVDEAALADFYAASDLFVMPSREIRLPHGKRVVEGFGIVYLEAALRGLPSIAGRAGGAPDAVEHGKTGLLVDPEDSAQLAEAIVRLLGDAELRTRMGFAARARVVEEFDMERNLAPLLGEMLRSVP